VTLVGQHGEEGLDFGGAQLARMPPLKVAHKPAHPESFPNQV